MSTRSHFFPRTRRRAVCAVAAAAVLASLLAGLTGAGAAAALPDRPPAHAHPSTASAAGGALAERKPQVYRVRPGDTLTAIARRVGMPMTKLYAINRHVIGDDPDRLMPGQRLSVPARGWATPVRTSYRISGRYKLPGSGWIAGYHTGVDLAVPTGTPVYSVGPGEVVSARDAGAYGKHILVRMDDGRYVLYAHLDRMSAGAGDRVRGGNRIGDAGSSGNATGPHLHLEVRKGPDYGTDVDPVAYLRKYGVHV